METAFVNPDNVDPGQDNYYDDQELLARYLLFCGFVNKIKT